MLRPFFVLPAFALLTTLLTVWFWLARVLHLPGTDTAALVYCRVICRLLRVRVVSHGEPRHGCVLVVANHTSWLDILVISSVAPVMFVAKREVAAWPLIGATAKMRGTIFVDRTQRRQSKAANAEIAARLASGQPVVLFAEGTSNDGNRVLPFRSALFGAARDALANASDGQTIALQPLSLAYTTQQGVPMNRSQRPIVAWYGDLDFAPHLLHFVRRGVVDAVLVWGDPVPYDGSADRKDLMKRLESDVKQQHGAMLRGLARAGERQA